MSDAATAGELRILGFEGTTPPEWLLDQLAAGRAGGAILFARNVGTPGEVARLCAALSGAVPEGEPAPVLAVDQEGGRVQRLRAPFTVWPPMARVGARGDLGLTRRVGQALGEELALVGLNLDFAPVADVHTNPANPVIGDRAFAVTPEAVAEQAVAMLEGLQAGGVLGCAKHFPGHGDTAQDSHLDLPRIEHDLERLRAVELPPFARLVAAGVPMVMTAHVVVAALDGARPATMSRAWIEGALRGELGFEGVVVSDDLDMKAVAERWPVEEVVRQGLAAGVDAFLLCRDPERQAQAEAALVAAARNPRLAPRVEEARARVRALRARLARHPLLGDEELAARLPHAGHAALAALAAQVA